MTLRESCCLYIKHLGIIRDNLAVLKNAKKGPEIK